MKVGLVIEIMKERKEWKKEGGKKERERKNSPTLSVHISY